MRAITTIVLLFVIVSLFDLVPIPALAAQGFPLNIYGLTIVMAEEGITRAEAIKRGNGFWAVPANFNVGPQIDSKMAFAPLGSIVISGRDATIVRAHRDGERLNRSKVIYTPSRMDLDVGRNIQVPAGSFGTQVGPWLHLARDGSLEIAWEKEGFTESFVEEEKERSALCTDNARERGLAVFDTAKTLQFPGALGKKKDSLERQRIARKMREFGVQDCLNLDGNSSLVPTAKSRVYWVFYRLDSRPQAAQP